MATQLRLSMRRLGRLSRFSVSQGVRRQLRRQPPRQSATTARQADHRRTSRVVTRRSRPLHAMHCGFRCRAHSRRGILVTTVMFSRQPSSATRSSRGFSVSGRTERPTSWKRSRSSRTSHHPNGSPSGRPGRFRFLQARRAQSLASDPDQVATSSLGFRWADGRCIDKEDFVKCLPVS